MEHSDKLEEQKAIKPKRKFHPCKTPRYFVEQVGEAACRMDLKMYNAHRKRVFYAKPSIDLTPPKLESKKLFKSFGFLSDMATLRQITLANIDLVKRINIVNRTGGRIDSFNPAANHSMSKWNVVEQRMQEISRQNKNMYKRLVKTKANYSYEDIEKDWKHTLQILTASTKFPLLIGKPGNIDKELQEQESIVGIPVDPKVAALRPRVFFEFSIRTNSGYVRLGKIFMELYSDIVPQTVNTFLEHCGTKKDGPTFLNKYFNKIFPEEYCELGELPLQMKRPTSLYFPTFPQENFTLKHNRTGVLSFAKKGKKSHNLQLSITFQAYPKFDNQRVAFGKIYKGNKLLLSLQEVGKANGAPSEKIIISNYGTVKMEIKL